MRKGGNLMQKKLPIGIENFEDMIKENYYYVDKTGLLKQLLNEHGLVNLFTRPRRFGKSLNMSMLKYFFEIGNDQSIFEGLEISKEKELCDQYQGKFPMISVSLKGAKAGNYADAKAMMKYIMAAESRRLYNRMSGDKLSEKQKEQMKSLMSDNMKDTELMTALWILSSILKDYYGKKVIILIDEYDVPLDKAFENNYYNEMIILLRNMLEQSLKTNDNLYMAVLTGCLRIARESIFTGLNNFNIFSITDQYFDEYFGFTDKEVKEIFESTVRKWFEDSARVTNRKDLFDAVWNKDADKATKEISTLLRMTISYYDYRENFYHAFLAGIFAGAGYSVESNREHGEGRSDIVIYNDVTGQVAVFEAKYSRKLEDLEKDCQKALDQINTKMYAKEFEDAYEEVLCYGIAFYKKRCLVKSK